MGRNAGWIAAASGLATREPQDAPHLIYMPEAAFTFEKLIRDVKEVYREFGRVFIIVGEGLKDEKGNTYRRGNRRVRQGRLRARYSLAAWRRCSKTIIEKEVGHKGTLEQTRVTAKMLDALRVADGRQRGVYVRQGGGEGGDERGQRENDNAGAGKRRKI